MHDFNNNIIGCVCCVVFSMEPRRPPTRRKSQTYMVLYFSDIHGDERTKCETYIPVNLSESLITVKSNHVWLTYFPLESSWDVLNETLFVEIACFEDYLGIEVKNCGYRWIYKQDLQELNYKMNHGNSLAGKRKFLAIEDEAQQQPKTTFLQLIK